MRISLDFQSCRLMDEVAMPRNLSQTCGICKIPYPHLVKRFLQEQSFLFHTWYTQFGEITYSAPLQLRNFFFDPSRSQDLYSAPWIIQKCWEAVIIKSHWDLELLNRTGALQHVSSFHIHYGLYHFFTPQKYCQISRASLMLSTESIRNGSNSDSLLGFLKYLSRIPWLDICFSSNLNALWTCAIANWVCKSLVSEYMPNLADVGQCCAWHERVPSLVYNLSILSFLCIGGSKNGWTRTWMMFPFGNI
jgi:hypothetical protein